MFAVGKPVRVASADLDLDCLAAVEQSKRFAFRSLNLFIFQFIVWFYGALSTDCKGVFLREDS